ncbi:hypothetical protein BV509_02880 [Rhodovulum sulfidophilum]|nr:hypothetical protein BV509_02880 [Rhodovulum sulfidophilum]
MECEAGTTFLVAAGDEGTWPSTRHEATVREAATSAGPTVAAEGLETTRRAARQSRSIAFPIVRCIALTAMVWHGHPTGLFLVKRVDPGTVAAQRDTLQAVFRQSPGPAGLPIAERPDWPDISSARRKASPGDASA